MARQKKTNSDVNNLRLLHLAYQVFQRVPLRARISTGEVNGKVFNLTKKIAKHVISYFDHEHSRIPLNFELPKGTRVEIAGYVFSL